MFIKEPDKRICKDCGKELESAKDGFGIPVFKVFYFERVWICINCFKEEAKALLTKRERKRQNGRTKNRYCKR